MTDRLVIRETQRETLIIAGDRLVIETAGSAGPAGIGGPQGPGGPVGPQGPAGAPADVEVLAQLVEDEIAEYDEEGPSLVLLYENVKV